jgi:SPP1 family predicted phage head-tail adaptor
MSRGGFLPGKTSRVSAGRLKKVIEIQERTETTDSFGGQVHVWSDVYSGVRAAKEPLSGRELIAAQAAQSSTTIRFIIRFLEGIDSSMRIFHDDKFYNITEIIDPEEAHRELQIMTSTGLNEG